MLPAGVIGVGALAGGIQCDAVVGLAVDPGLHLGGEVDLYPALIRLGGDGRQHGSVHLVTQAIPGGIVLRPVRGQPVDIHRPLGVFVDDIEPGGGRQDGGIRRDRGQVVAVDRPFDDAGFKTDVQLAVGGLVIGWYVAADPGVLVDGNGIAGGTAQAAGEGGGVVDILKRRKLENATVYELHNNAVPKDGEKYENLAAESWFEFRDNVENIEFLPNDEEMKSQCAGRQYTFKELKGRTGTGKTVKAIEPKANYKKRYEELHGQSPDRADAIVLWNYEPPTRPEPLAIWL